MKFCDVGEWCAFVKVIALVSGKSFWECGVFVVIRVRNPVLCPQGVEDLGGDVVLRRARGLSDFPPNVVVVVARKALHVAIVVLHDGGEQGHGELMNTGLERHTATGRKGCLKEDDT